MLFLKSKIYNRTLLKFLSIIFLSFLTCGVSWGQKTSHVDYFKKTRELKEKNDWAALYTELTRLEKEFLSLKDNDLIYLSQFFRAESLYAQGKFSDAILKLEELKLKEGVFQDYVYFYLAHSYMQQANQQLAQKYFDLVTESKTNGKLRVESQINLSKIYNNTKQYVKALAILKRLEKRSRNEFYYPDVIYEMAKTQQSLRNHGQFCKWVAKLYEKFPIYPMISTWGFDLEKNLFEGKATRCQATHDEKKNRIRNLQWAGLGESARVEVVKLENTIGGMKNYEAVKLHAQYLIYDGHITEALEILTPHIESKKYDYNFLMMIGGAYLRMGNGAKAAENFYRAYSINPRYKKARESLFQSALILFQYQDYENAEKRFLEFKKKYPGSSFTRDIEWKLAWIDYIKGNYSEAYKKFVTFKNRFATGRQKKKISKEAVYYWISMSLMKMNKLEKAKEGFEALTQDRLKGYYSILSKQRLNQIEELIKKTTPQAPRVAEKIYTRFNATEIMISSIDGYSVFTNPDDFDEISFDQDNNEVAAEDNIESPIEDTTEDKEVVEIADANVGEDGDAANKIFEFTNNPAFIVKNKDLVARFEKARFLMMIGQFDFAKWELYEVEKKTRDKEFLKQLISEYERIDSYNRSSYIAQVNLGPDRIKLGLEAGKSLWHSCYPKAYSEHVESTASKTGVNPFLIWSIMRAESTYKSEIRSPVGALGLMQVMPITGKKVAQLIKLNEFRPDDLLIPQKSIFIGASYLKKLNGEFNGNIALVAASYNAGPHRTWSWLKNFGNMDLDEYVEHIPFLETRNYVKKVVTNYNMYNLLYSSNSNKDVISFMTKPSMIKLPNLVPTRESWDAL